MSQPTMQAIRIHQYGGPEVLTLESVPRPQPQVGEVLIEVRAAGVLPADWKTRQGSFHAFRPIPFPWIPGSAVAGIVAAVGPGVEAFAPGQAVFGRTVSGAYAEFTVTPVAPPALQPGVFSLLAPKPAELSFVGAATISGGATTAWEALFSDGKLQAGQRVLIHGGAGGVGAYAVQFAHWRGAHVIATASWSNVEFVRSLGADQVIDYTTTPFERAVGEVDLVLDTIGGETLRRSIPIVKRGGLLISLLEEPPQVLAEAYGIRAMHNATLPTSATLQAIAELIAKGEVKAIVGKTVPLSAARQAHEWSQTGHGRGRIVLLVGADENKTGGEHHE